MTSKGVTQRVPALRRMPGIDGLRAIAVSAVFLYHAGIGWLPGGFLGVDVFFVISGYLISSLLLSEFGATGRIDLWGFWQRRARRLLPALFLLLATCLMVGATVDRGQLVGLRTDAIFAALYTVNWHFIFEHQSYFSQFGRPPLLRHLWSLSVEEQFYLVWPLIFVLGMRVRRRMVLPIVVGLGALGSTALMWILYSSSDTSRVFYGTDTRAAPLLVGVLLAFAWKPSSLPALSFRGARPALNALSLLALAAVAYELVTVHATDTSLYHGGFLAMALASALLVATVAHPLSLLGRALGSPVPRWIGRRSYGIYLWHWPVLMLSRPGIDVHLARGILIPLQAVVTVAIAAASYHFVEQPIRTGTMRAPRLPFSLRRPARALVLAGAGLFVLLIAVTPQGASALPPGFSKHTLEQSKYTSTHLVPLPKSTLPATRPPAPQRPSHHPVTMRTLVYHPDAHPLRISTLSATVKPAPTAIPHTGPILAVGDSVMLGSAPALRSALGPELRVDAVVGRQAHDTIDRLVAYRAAGELPQRVIVHIGDNGPIYASDLHRLRQVLAGVPLVVLVNVRVGREWQGEVDSELAGELKGWTQATIADWYDASAGSGIVVGDGTHPTPTGQRIFAALIARAVHHPVLGAVTH